MSVLLGQRHIRVRQVGCARAEVRAALRNRLARRSPAATLGAGARIVYRSRNGQRSNPAQRAARLGQPRRGRARTVDVQRATAERCRTQRMDRSQQVCDTAAYGGKSPCFSGGTFDICQSICP